METYEQRAALFAMFSDATRLRVIEELLASDTRCVTDLAEALGISIANLSNHLRFMRINGLVNVNKRGKQSFYSLSRPEETKRFLDATTTFLKDNQV